MSATVGGSPGAAPVGLSVDDDRLVLPEGIDPETTYDVLLNDLHVWSLTPARDTQGRRAVPWPKALRAHLVGQAAVRLREHVSGAEVAAADHVFAGQPDKAVSVTDSGGHPLVLDKWGRLIRPLSNEGTALIDELMDEVREILRVLEREVGVASFICYGTLLGAVRNGRLIGHDNDVDVAYLSEHPHPYDVVREAYRVERALLDHGYTVRRGSGVRINVRLHLSDGSLRCVDVFTAHWVEGILYIPSDTGFELPREVILPLGEVELMGHPMPAPAQPERLLAATYGEGWLVPDPSFRYETPRWLSRRLSGWFGGLNARRKRWDAFHSKERHKVPDGPSDFARWVAREYPSSRPLVDLGSGTGRDAVWFGAEQGRRVTGLDYCLGAVTHSRARVRGRRLPVRFRPFNLYDTRQVLALGARLSRNPTPPDLYARFLLHNLEAEGRRNLLRLASMALRREGLLFCEFRTPLDRDRSHVFGDHARFYLNPDDVIEEVEAAGGRVVHLEQGTGRAVLGAEDPHVCRIVATWSESPQGRVRPSARRRVTSVLREARDRVARHRTTHQ